MGYAGVCLFFLFLLQNIDCGYSTIYVLVAKKEKYQNLSAENFQFSKLKKSLFIAWACFRNGRSSYNHFRSTIKMILTATSVLSIQIVKILHVSSSGHIVHHLWQTIFNRKQRFRTFFKTDVRSLKTKPISYCRSNYQTLMYTVIQ